MTTVVKQVGGTDRIVPRSLQEHHRIQPNRRTCLSTIRFLQWLCRGRSLHSCVLVSPKRDAIAAAGLRIRWSCSRNSRPTLLISLACLVDQPESKRDRVLKLALECRVGLLAYARSLLGNYSQADDVVQEAMLVVTRKYDEFEEGTSMLAGCRSIVRIEVLRARQRQQRDQSLARRLLDDAVDAAFEEFQEIRQRDDAETWREALERCLQRIPDRGRRVLDARFTDGLGYQQIGERVGMSLEAVRKALFRLKKQVRTCVESNLRGAQ